MIKFLIRKQKFVLTHWTLKLDLSQQLSSARSKRPEHAEESCMLT